MIPFYLVFFILSFFVFIDISTFSNKQKLLFVLIVYLLLSIFAGFRASSPDYEAYAEVFKILGNNNIKNENIVIVANDPSYMLLNRIIAHFASSPIALFLTVALISVGINLYSYRKYTPFFFTAVILYFVHTYIGRELMQIRSGIACAICLYSIQFIINKEKWKFLFSILIAASFHLVAISFICAYALCSLNFSLRIWKCLILVSIIIGLFYPLGQLIKMIPAIDFLERIQNYNEWDEYNSSLGVFTNPTVLKTLFITLLSMGYFNKLQNIHGFKVFFDLYAFSLCWLMCFSDYGIFCARIATVFSIVEVIICSYFYSIVTPRSRWVVSVLLILFAFIMLSLNIYTGRTFDYKFAI